MVDIIKSEDLTLDEIKSRIISLDSRFAQGEIGFTDRYGVYNSLSGKYSEKGINLFTSLLTQLTGRNTVFPYYHVITHKDPQSSKPACDTLDLIDEYCKELLKMRNTSKELKGSSADVIAYLALHGKGEVFKKVLLNFKFNNNDRALEICEHLHELVSRASIECCDLDDSELIQSLATYGTSRSIRTVQDFIESTDRSLSFAECYVKICKVDNTALRVTVIQTQTTPLSTRFEQFVKELAKLNELYTDVVQHIQQHNLKRLEKVYTEALELFNELNAYAISQIRSANIQDASEREFYICDVCLDDDQFSNTTESFDLVRDLKISELLDPFKTSESLKRPKGLIEELENLCNHNIVKRYSMKNDDLPNRISIVDARKRVLIELINHPNTIRKLAFKHLNDRLGTSQPRSKERKVLRHFKQEIQPYVDKMIDIYDNLQIYIDAPFNQRLTDEMIDALNKDLENGNNDEKRRIIDEVSIAIKEIEQLSQSIHDAYQDMLIHAYSTES